MIISCAIEKLPQCVDIAFLRTNQPENNSAFCPKSRESIVRDFEFILKNPGCLMVGCYYDNTLSGILGCFLNSDMNWVDCIGPFFKNAWDSGQAEKMLLYAQSAMGQAVRFNFYFNKKNESCHRLMGALSARRQDNEYILLLDRGKYKPQAVKQRIVPYTCEYEAELIALHSTAFPQVYITGQGIVSALGKTREVFCALDEKGAFAGYGVLKHADGAKRATAEIFAVKEEKRGQGYGWALLSAVVNSAFSRHSAESVDLVVDKLNLRARALYESCGFQLVVENEAYYLGE